MIEIFRRHSGIVNAHSGIVNARSGIVNAPSGIVNAPSGIVNAPIIIKTHKRDETHRPKTHPCHLGKPQIRRKPNNRQL